MLRALNFLILFHAQLIETEIQFHTHTHTRKIVGFKGKVSQFDEFWLKSYSNLRSYLQYNQIHFEHRILWYICLHYLTNTVNTMSNMYSNNVTRVRVEYASEISNGLRCYIQDTIGLTFLGWPVLTKYLNAQTQNYPLGGSQFSAYQILLVRKSCNKKLRWRHLVLKMSTSFVFDFAREKKHSC